MNLQSLLGDYPIQQFIAEYYQRLPYSSVGNKALSALANWNLLTKLIAAARVDLLVCKRNEQYAAELPTTADEATRLVDDGYTLLIRHAEQHDQRLAELSAAFARDFAAPVNIHMYCTPGGQYGFGWHYDAEEVFIIQTTGRKEYRLRKNTVNPWPIEETLPADMHYEREIMPLVRCELAAGDWLYIPSGYWHMGESRETAISLAIGVQPRTAIDVFDFLRPQILDSLFWRQRLPVFGDAATVSQGELKAACAEIFQRLGGELSKMLSDPRLGDAFVRQLRPEMATKNTKSHKE